MIKGAPPVKERVRVWIHAMRGVYSVKLKSFAMIDTLVLILAKRMITGTIGVCK